MNETLLDESLILSRQLRTNAGVRNGLIRWYWRWCFGLTRRLELWQRDDVRLKNATHSVMNYGCGNKFYDGAVNVDLFAPHRFLLGKRRPDRYWSGTATVPLIERRFDSVICEHVIEHILPDGVQLLFMNFCKVLRPGGIVVISFPDIARVMNGGLCQGYVTITASVNSLIYRHGHCYMYDAQLVIQLLVSAGFVDARAVDFADLPYRGFIGEGRARETTYVVARCPG